MIDKKVELLGWVNKLSQSLMKSNNEGPAKFFDGLYERLEKAESPEEFEAILKEISTLATLAQYGDFSSAEEALLANVQNCARKIV
jgi:hypothetical protein